MPHKDPEARRAYRKAYYERNREALLAQMCRYRAENRETLLEKNRLAARENAEERAERQRRYYQENREAALASRAAYKAENKDRSRALSQRWYKGRQAVVASPKTGRWDAEEDALVLRDDLTLTQIAVKLQRSYSAVMTRRSRLKSINARGGTHESFRPNRAPPAAR